MCMLQIHNTQYILYKYIQEMSKRPQIIQCLWRNQGFSSSFEENVFYRAPITVGPCVVSCCYGDEKGCRWNGLPLRDMHLPIYSISTSTGFPAVRTNREHCCMLRSCLRVCNTLIYERTHCLFQDQFVHKYVQQVQESVLPHFDSQGQGTNTNQDSQCTQNMIHCI